MDEQDKKLYAWFSEKEQLLSKEPTYAAAFAAEPAQLKAGAARVQACFAQLPPCQLDEEQRSRLSTRRFPELHGVVSLLQSALERHKDLSHEIDTRPETVARVLRLDMALGRLCWASELVMTGGENGDLLTAAAMQALCQGLIQKAAQTGSMTTAQRAAVTAAFTEPSRIEQQRKDREESDAAKNEKSATPVMSKINAGQESAARARIVEAFLEQTAQPVRRGT